MSQIETSKGIAKQTYNYLSIGGGNPDYLNFRKKKPNDFRVEEAQTQKNLVDFQQYTL